jgi:DHA1 family bicyclomycin/chloramphenicol resistance-like MFS transporter
MTILLAALSALGPFSIDTYLPSFHDIEQSLNATPLEVQQTLTAYMLPFAIMSRDSTMSSVLPPEVPTRWCAS